MKKPTIGHIDCPYCAGVQTMRVTHDKNEKPFGHCDDCNGQLRVGGNTFREKKFLGMYPWAAGTPAAPVTVTEPKPAESTPEAHTHVPLPPATPAQAANTHAPQSRRSTFADALNLLGGAR